MRHLGYIICGCTIKIVIPWYNDWQGWNGGNLAPSRDLYGNLYQDKLGMPFEKFPDGDIRKKAFRVISNDGDYEGFFLMELNINLIMKKGMDLQMK